MERRDSQEDASSSRERMYAYEIVFLVRILIIKTNLKLSEFVRRNEIRVKIKF